MPSIRHEVLIGAPAECSYRLKSLCESGTGRPWPHQHRSEERCAA